MATLGEKLRADREDLNRAREGTEPETEAKPWYRCLGPGLVTGAADDDPSGVGTYSANGAQFGASLLWLAIFCLPLMIAVQEMCGRLAAVTGKGIAAILKENYSVWLLYATLGLLAVANIFNIYADLNVMAATLKMLLGVPVWVGLVGFTVLLALTQIFIPYRQYSAVLKWLCLTLVGYAIVAFFPGIKHDWPGIARGLLVPSLDMKPSTMLAVVAFLGTTISPYLFFWQAGETVEVQITEENADRPGERKRPVQDHEIRNLRSDTVTGMVASQAVAVCIIVAAASTLHVGGHTQIETAQDAAKALAPLGASATWIFSLCIIGTGLLAIPTLAGSVAYSVAETFGWRYGLYRRFERAKGFYLTIAAVIALGCLLNFLGGIKPVTALVYSAVLNGIIAVPIIVILLLICNNEQIVGKRKNKRWSNIFGVLAALLMAAASIYFLFALATGKVS